jgi:peptidyl-prolyl cis-trans isomerase B (cyclophilin B)
MYMSKKIGIGAVILVLVILGVYFSRAKNTEAPVETPPSSKTIGTEEEAPPPPAVAQADCIRNVDQAKMGQKITDIKNKFVTMTVKGYGDVTIKLNDVEAPQTVANFLKLVDVGFYNCLTFHRITDIGGPSMPGRIVQGGDPEGTGMGGPGYTVPAEIKLTHTRGAIATARTGDQVNPKRDSSGSQFYIAVDPLPFLDNQYTVFGYVVSGMDVVEKMSAVETNAAGMPALPVVIEKALITSN